jgi:uncharacterized protein YndB with AHSA1/START domain
MTTPDLSVRTCIRASSVRVWEAIAEPGRIAEWSPESTGVSDNSAGPLPVGATFSGSNRNGPWRWSTQCVVVESLRGEAFAFDVSFLGLTVARWRYAISAGPDGVDVEEQWWDRRGRVMKVLGALGTGVVDRRSHNEAGMHATLAALRVAMEASGPGEA